MARALALAERVQHSLDASGAQVVIIARAGQDLSKYGLELVAPGVRLPRGHARAASDPTAPPVLGLRRRVGRGRPPRPPQRGTWRIVHKLNQCGTAEAAVFRQGLAEFFMDTPFRYEAAYVVPAARGAGRADAHGRARPATRAVAHASLQRRRLPVVDALPAEQPMGARDAGRLARSRQPPRASAPSRGCTSTTTSPPCCTSTPSRAWARA